jgi:multidrug efflux pump subunit AcrB/outer membrane protein TolC
MDPVKASLRYPLVALVLAALSVAAGLHAFLTMPRMEDPSITIRTGLVLAAYPGATSDQVENQVTKKVEEHIFKFREIRREKTYSTSRPGLMVINVELEESVKNADQFWAKFRHEMNETAATELPQGVRGPIVNSDFGDTVALLIAIHGKRYGYRELRDYSDQIQDELRSIRDVGKLASYGGQSEQIWITSSLDRVSQYFADPLRVIQSLQQRNVISSSGNVETAQAKVPLRTSGAFTSEEQIGNVLVDVSRTGQPVYLHDFASVERRYQDPSFVVRYDGAPSVLLSVEMQKGKNIVQLGEQIDTVLARLHNRLPPDLQLDLITNQPAVVKARISRLTEEFLLAIGAVILVTIVLLPIRVAVIAALAIPVTVTTTLGVLNLIGVQLHQVSIAALIMVLGIVVDDAIVITDNYVDLLDRGVARGEAAWKCVHEVVVPVLTATLTIIASFLPLLILTGSMGEFIDALPITVAVALSVSFVVAVLVTPLMCRFFIRQGLHDHAAVVDPNAKKKFSMLDSLQAAYNRTILYFLAHKTFAVGVGVAGVLAGVAIFPLVPEQFFPSAERNQFVVDVWMPEGSRIEATAAAMGRIEQQLAQNHEIVHYASFIGQSAPRFYYNVNPQQPDAAYGQFIVNTESQEATPGLVAELRTTLARVAPEALVIVKELQQGQILEAPIEVRIAGDDVAELKRIGRQVEDIVRADPHAEYVYNDYFNDSYRVDVDVDNEIANRIGVSNAIISQILAGGFSGAPVGTLWEGNRAVTLLLRIDAAHRASFDDVGDAYVTSPLTHASVPLRSIANLEPHWQTSRIVRRNGVRTLTVRAFPRNGYYASRILKAIQPKLDALALPSGYQLYYGGEKRNRDETFPQLMGALAISIVAIFLVLLLQFRNISEPFIVMCSIPLTLFGAMFGLLITNNTFGFTAFTGLIALCGIVVRNAIILVDYINERLRQGEPIETAAAQAGARRLRPIFLTTMAAAVGVTPMILSRSSLWSPLASVIAVGLICSMFFTLLVVPVLFVIVKSRTSKLHSITTTALVLIVLACSMPLRAESRKLTLNEAVDLALKQNTALKIARAQLREQQFKTSSARADYLPMLSTDATVSGLSDRQIITIPAGSLGSVPGLGPFPLQAIPLSQGGNTFLLSTTTLAQPLTQMFKIHAGVQAARAGENVAAADLRKAEDEVVLGVHQLYFGLLAANRQAEAYRAELAASEAALADAQESVKAGNSLDVVVLGGRAAMLKSKQGVIAAEIQVADLTSELNDALALPPATTFELADPEPIPTATPTREQYLTSALDHNPGLWAARETVRKAQAGVSAARDAYIPNVGAFTTFLYQHGTPFFTDHDAMFGLKMDYTLFDWGKRRDATGERRAQLDEAQQNLRRVTDRIAVDVEKAYRKLERTRQMIEVADEALALRRESERLSGEQFKAGVTNAAKLAEAVAATKRAEADQLQASLAYRMALAEIDRVAAMPRP